MIRAIALDHGHDPGLASLPAYQHAALEAIASCGTIAAGVHAERCDHCADVRWVPNTCGHRSCPHCQGRERAAWVQARMAELLPCGYFHAVLTLPPGLRPLADHYRSVVLDLLMRAASDAIAEQARSPRFLGAEVGQLAILHTWTREIGWHPHVHVMVTAGGWDAERQRWVDARTYGLQKRPFLVPVDALRASFRRQLRRLLLRAWADGAFADDALGVADLGAFTRLLDQALAVPIVIRIEPPFAGPTTLVKYLGAYVNGTAVSPKRVVYDQPRGLVTLHWRANATPDQPRTTTLPAVAFLKRFAQHVLPPRFQRIRFRGLWSTAHRRTKLERVRAALQRLGRGMTGPSQDPPVPIPLVPSEHQRCPICGVGHYQRLPGPVPRPGPRERRRILAALRSGGIPSTHAGATTAA
jgi:hypothetical protein